MELRGADRVLVRHAELGVKSESVRRKMEERLAANLRAILDDRGLDGEIDQRRNRLFVHTDDPDAVAGAAADTFGVAAASPVVATEPTLSAIIETLTTLASAHYDGGTFAVDARRAGRAEAHPFSSQDIQRDGGEAVWNAIEVAGGEPEVDLDDPDFELSVECREDAAFVYRERREGPGGLPVGSQDPLVALVSGGIDSPVAAWQAMKRGCPVMPVYVDLGPYGGPDHRARAERTVAHLARYAPHLDWTLHVVPGGEVVTDLADSLSDLRMLAVRRFMLAAAGAIAEDVDAVGVVTGEAIGQKSSQTSANLAATDPATRLPVHRPNLTLDKAEITTRARQIGTFEDSTIDAGCTRVAPDSPETRATLAAVEAAEPDDLLARAAELAAEAERVGVDGAE